MPMSHLEVRGYRSLRQVRLPLEALTVITGPNGSGKSNLYRALGLIARVAEGEFAKTIAREGGLLSTMWAGPRLSAKLPVRMALAFGIDDFNFQLECGFPTPSYSRFNFDPQIKEEVVWHGARRKPSTTLLERAAGLTWLWDLDGQRVDYPLTLDPNESVLAQLREPPPVPGVVYLAGRGPKLAVLSRLSHRR